jgi:hypothetical protein
MALVMALRVMRAAEERFQIVIRTKRLDAAAARPAMTIFDSQSLANAVASSLAGAGVPSDHKNAFVLVATTEGGVQATFSTRVGDGWNVELIGRASKWSKIEGGVQVVKTW